MKSGSLHFEECQPNRKGWWPLRTDYISPDDLEAVFRALTPQNELVLRVCEETGIRVGDALSLRTDALKARFSITEAKTGKRRRVYLRKPLLDALRASAGPVYVFSGRLDDTKHRTRQAVWKDLKRAARAFRIQQNIAPHSVRKLYAVELARHGYDLDDIQRALNHDSPAVTALYLMAGLVSDASRPVLGKRRRHARPIRKDTPGEADGPDTTTKQ